MPATQQIIPTDPRSNATVAYLGKVVGRMMLESVFNFTVGFESFLRGTGAEIATKIVRDLCLISALGPFHGIASSGQN